MRRAEFGGGEEREARMRGCEGRERREKDGVGSGGERRGEGRDVSAMSPFEGQKEGEGTPVQERRRCEHRNDRVLPSPPLHTKVDTLTVLLIGASDLTARIRRTLSS